MYAKECKALCLQLDERTKKLIEGAKQKGVFILAVVSAYEEIRLYTE